MHPAYLQLLLLLTCSAAHRQVAPVGVAGQLLLQEQAQVRA